MRRVMVAVGIASISLRNMVGSTMKKLPLISLFAVTIASCNAVPEIVKDLGDGLYGHIKTDKGDIVLRLFYERAPLTVSNFVGLAEGILENSHVDGQPFYNGLVFHRVVDDFVIQGGDPEGNGSGGPGYNFPDEFHAELRHDKKGMVSMANSGPNTNGSQFFITLTDTPWLDDKHSVFGEVVVGMEVVETIAESDSMRSVDIIRVGDGAKKFNVSQEEFTALINTILEAQRAAALERKNAAIATIKEKWSGVTENKDGMFFEILKNGTGRAPVRGDRITVQYTIETLEGRVIDSSYSSGSAPPQFVFLQDRVLPAWELAIGEMQIGEKRRVISPPELSFGTDGLEGFIESNAYVYYELELVSVEQ